jgi:hypothetical protein
MNWTKPLSYVASAILLTMSQAVLAGPPAAHGGGMSMGAPSGGMPGGAAMGGVSSNGRPSSGWTMPTHDAHATTGATNAAHANPEAVLDHSARLDAQLQKFVPSGSTPRQACAGFGELGGCVAALHVANELHIPFDDLKLRMTGHESSSLGEAIHALRPDVDARHAQHEAEKQARRDLAAAAD